MSDLPAIISPDGEPIQLYTAQDLLRSRGIEDVETADLEQLARFVDEAKEHVRRIIDEAVGEVSDELVRRLDKRGKWTVEVDGLKVTAPSPEAGTTSYEADKLELALRSLIASNVIDEDAANAALELVDPEPYLKVKQAGVKALLKLPAAREVIEACRIEHTPPPRKATVKRA